MSVQLYDPKTMQGSVWNESDVAAKIKDGFMTVDSFKEYQKKVIDEMEDNYNNKIKNDRINKEKFRLLRLVRNRKISETDYLLSIDYPLSEDKKKEIEKYRKLLRDLPSQDGAPWDGGGDETPWPKNPKETWGYEE